MQPQGDEDSIEIPIQETKKRSQLRISFKKLEPSQKHSTQISRFC